MKNIRKHKIKVEMWRTRAKIKKKWDPIINKKMQV